MTKSEKLKEAYNIISGELAYLPNKKWKSLNDYRIYYSYLKDSDIKIQVINFHLSLDYQLSLYELHRPVGNFEETTFLIVCYLVGSISEAVLRDLYFHKMGLHPDHEFIESVLNENSRIMFNSLLEVFDGILEKQDLEYLRIIKKLRNTIHINRKMNTIDVIENTGHIITLKIKDYLNNKYITKKILDFNKLEKDFKQFVSNFKRYY